jgi:hypothetical protein
MQNIGWESCWNIPTGIPRRWEDSIANDLMKVGCDVKQAEDSVHR